MVLASKIAEAYRKRSEVVAEKSRSVRCIVLFKDGMVSRDVKERAYDAVLYNIPIEQYYYNQKSRLLFCYDDGHVNALVPKLLLEGKLKEKGLKMRGFKHDTGRTLVRVMVCHEDDYLVICSRVDGNKKYIKAVPVHVINTHKTMDAGGVKCLSAGIPVKWLIAPKELQNTLQPIIYKSPSPGKMQESCCSLVDALFVQNALAMEMEPKPVEQLEAKA